MRRVSMGIAAACGLMGAGAAMGDNLAGWTFETSVPASAGPFAAEGGLNGASSFASGFHSDGAAVYSSPAGNGSPHSFSSNTWTIGDYYQFTTSTLGYKDITFGWDETRSGTGPTTFDLAWSLDGVNFTTLVDDYTLALNANPPGFWNSANYFADYTFAPVLGPTDLNNKALVYFRLTNQQAPGGNSGTNRVDNIIIDGTVPAPGGAALLGVAAVIAGRRRR